MQGNAIRQLGVVVLLAGLISCSNSDDNTQNTQTQVIDDPNITQASIDQLYLHTKTLGEKIIIEDFEIPQLDTARTVRIYLPPDYGQSDRAYPVVYLQDGQQIFLSDAPTETDSWRVDQTLDEQYWLGLHDGMIAVAVDFSGTRAQEYIPYALDTDDFTISHSLSADLAAFMVDTLKPYMDSHYRTLTGREDTYIMGASFGAFFALYTAFEYPEVYGGVGAYSSALWYGLDQQFIQDIADHDGNLYPMRLMNYASPGDEQGATAMYQAALEYGFGPSVLMVDPQGAHHPNAWAQAFWHGILWLMDKQQRYEPDWLTHPADWYFTEPEPIEGYMTQGTGVAVPAGNVTFTFSGEARSVSMLGGWNNWDTIAYEYIDGIWQVTVPIEPGSYSYGLVVDGEWVHPLWSTVIDLISPVATTTAPGNLGGIDAVLVVE